MYLDKNNVDIVIRVFHWLLAALFVLLFVTGSNHHDTLHILLGYLLTSLIISRIMWGIIGPHNALWKNYFYTLKSILGYLSKLIQNEPITFKIHNPAGSTMILVMLLILIMVIISGLLTQGLFELDGIFYTLTQYFSDPQAFLVRSTHDALSQIMIFVIIFHIIGVVYSSKIYNINLLLMMINGKPHCFKKEKNS